MNTKDLLMNEIEEVPEPLLSEVLDFVHFLKAKLLREKMDIAVWDERNLFGKGLDDPRGGRSVAKFVRGDVAVIPFPFSDLSQSKRRPGPGPCQP